MRVLVPPGRVAVDGDDDVHDLRHGYTMADLDRLSRAAVTRSATAGFASSGDQDDRYATAWDAIAHRLYTAEETPTGYDLIGAGMRALSAESDDYRRHHGYRDNTRAFGVFWLDIGGPTGSPEAGIVERAALAQIWPRLPAYQRTALTALATFDDYRLAAEALGKDYKSFATVVSQARRTFLALWHEGEEPSRPWGNDRRRSDGTRRNAVTRHVKYRKGRAKADPVHGKATTYRNYKCRCTPCREAARAEQSERRARLREAS